MRTLPHPSLLLFILFCAAVGHASGAQQPAQTCADAEGFRKLDFWIGDWDVFAGERRVGTNRIEKILNGCAILEHWKDTNGSEGKSLFYFVPATGTWKQVWVSDNATRSGGVKEKQLIEELADGGLRFRGEVAVAGGGSYLDQTTLTRKRDGSVRQLIEISRDGGRTWQVMFDGRYVRTKRE